MAEPLGPLGPWKLAAVMLFGAAAWHGWQPTWDPFLSWRNWQNRVGLSERGGDAEVLADRPGGHPLVRRWDGGLNDPLVLTDLPEGTPGSVRLLLIGNSRLGFPVQSRAQRAEVAEAAGIEGAVVGLVGGPWMRLSDVQPILTRVARFAPDLVVIQADLLLPGPEGNSESPAVEAYRDFAVPGRERLAGLELVATLGAERVVVVDFPLPGSILEELGPAWVERRAAAVQGFAEVGWETRVLPAAWPDHLYERDLVHYDPAGAREMRLWLGAGVR